MSNEILTRDILKFATDNARAKLPESFGENGFFGAKLSGEDNTLNFYSQFRDSLEKNGAIAESNDISADRKNGSRATAFTSSVLTSLFMTDVLRDNIDEFFDNPENDYQFRNQTPEEKEAFRQELKDKVRNDLTVKPKTREGEALAEQITQRFDRILDFKAANRGQAKQFKENDGFDMSKLGADLYSEGMSALYAINVNLRNGKSISETAKSVRENAPQNSSFYKIILEGFENDAKELAAEEEVITHTVKQFSVPVNNPNDITPTGFVEHYQKGKLSPEEKGWAMNIAQKMGIEYSDFENLKLDGKPMFEGWQLHREDELDRTVDVVASVLTGKQVALENQKDEKLTLLNPSIKGQVKERENKSILDRIIEFFKDLVSGTTSLEREQNKIEMMDLDAQKAKTNFMEKSRERISFKELSGLNSLKKVTAPQNQNTLSAEKKGVSRGR